MFSKQNPGFPRFPGVSFNDISHDGVIFRHPNWSSLKTLAPKGRQEAFAEVGHEGTGDVEGLVHHLNSTQTVWKKEKCSQNLRFLSEFSLWPMIQISDCLCHNLTQPCPSIEGQ